MSRFLGTEYYRKEKEEAEKRGIAKGKAEIAQMLLAEGMSVEFIVKITGLSITEIQQLRMN